MLNSSRPSQSYSSTTTIILAHIITDSLIITREPCTRAHMHIYHASTRVSKSEARGLKYRRAINLRRIVIALYNSKLQLTARLTYKALGYRHDARPSLVWQCRIRGSFIDASMDSLDWYEGRSTWVCWLRAYEFSDDFYWYFWGVNYMCKVCDLVIGKMWQLSFWFLLKYLGIIDRSN